LVSLADAHEARPPSNAEVLLPKRWTKPANVLAGVVCGTPFATLRNPLELNSGATMIKTLSLSSETALAFD
jgi:hypothetical protein